MIHPASPFSSAATCADFTRQTPGDCGHWAGKRSTESPVTLPEIGDRVEIIPNHACTAVNLAGELVVAKDGEVIAVWPVQGRGKTR